jgi:hypothetical protein
MRKEDAKKLRGLRKQDEFFMDEKDFMLASCDHNIDGKPATERLNANQSRCKICGKIINFSNLPNKEKLDEAFAIVDTALDLIKLGNDDLDDEVRQELGRISVHQQPIKKLYKKVRRNLTERPNRPIYPGMPGAELGIGNYLFRNQGFGGGGQRILDDNDVFDRNYNKKKKKKNRNRNRYYNEY